MNFTFDQFLQNDQWTTLKDYYSSFGTNVEKNIETALKNDRRDELRAKFQQLYGIKKSNQILQDELKKDLLTGNVVAVDGTCSHYDLMTVGFQAIIGIVSVNYKNKKAIETIYISEPFIPYDKTDFEEIFKFAKQKKSGIVGLSSQHIRAIMLFKEREFILNRTEKYKMVQGDIFPYELRNGQGRLRGLSTCIKLGRKLLNERNIIATQTTTGDPRLKIVGRLLDPGEYIILQDYYEDLNSFLNGDEYTQRAHFAPEEQEQFRLFIEDARNKFVVGVYKAQKSKRAYVFYAPKDNLETMVNLLFIDSSYQPIRGFPLLLDFADSLCTRLLSTEDFKKQIESKLARKDLLEVEKNEKSLRRR